jgi:hypothetical protein
VVVAGLILGAWLVVVVSACGAQRALLFPAPKTVEQPSSASRIVDLPTTVLMIRPPPTPEAKVVLHFHGNGEQLAWLEGLADAWAEAGVGFVAAEYPGYGLAKEKGAPSEASIIEAAETAAKYVEGELGIARARG